jgi:hypothetical protein
MSTLTEKHEARRSMAPVFCGISGSYRAKRTEMGLLLNIDYYFSFVACL